MSGKIEFPPCRVEMELTEPQLTFRDPAGQLQLAETHAFRRVHPTAVEETLALLASPLRSALERDGALIPTEIENAATHPTVLPGELWLRHPRIEPISYPWEWTTAQWVSAADLTLSIAERAIDAGWTLKDATPLNILFVNTRPVLVDVLSLQRRDRTSSSWLAYGQFVRAFLLPLMAEKHLNWPLQATLFSRDGYEPGALYRALRPWQRLYPSLFDVVTLATLLERPHKIDRMPSRLQKGSDPELARHILHKRIARLRRQINRAARTEHNSQWSGYQQSATHYSPTDNRDKQQFVKSAFEKCRPARVLDLGANTGAYSLIAAEYGADVVALDSDTAAIEALWRNAARADKKITALVANIARPTPAVGWKNREQLSLLERLAGKFDLVLMLAVIHHLILREQIPLGHLGELCAMLTRRWLVLEWVPPSDPMFQEWLHGRGELYGGLTENHLKEGFAPFFHVVDRAVLGNGRVLFLFDRREGEPPMQASPA